MTFGEAIETAKRDAITWNKEIFVLQIGSDFLVATTPQVDGAKVVTKFEGYDDAISRDSVEDDEDEW